MSKLILKVLLATGLPLGQADLCGTVTCTPATNSCQTNSCEPATGDCVLKNKPANAPCDDGNSKTINDKCDETLVCAGVDYCVGVVCGPPDYDSTVACQTTWECDSAQTYGLCGYVNDPDGTACDDGDDGTERDTCNAEGECRGKAKDPCAGVKCDAPNSCQVTNSCDPNSGKCVPKNKDIGEECDDGKDTTVNDKCEANGVCAGDDRCANVKCDAPNSCQVTNSCDPNSGKCVPENKPAGTTCDDGDDGTERDTCNGEGQCVGEEKPPVAPLPPKPPVAPLPPQTPEPETPTTSYELLPGQSAGFHKCRVSCEQGNSWWSRFRNWRSSTETLRNQTWEECQDACTADSKCIGIEYDKKPAAESTARCILQLGDTLTAKPLWRVRAYRYRSCYIKKVDE